jgi:hypothetical protein
MQKELRLISAIDKEYKGAWRIAILSLVGFVVFAIFSIYMFAQQTNNVIKNKLVVVASDLGNEYLIDKKAQLVGHLENFHILFFRIDEFNYKNSIEKSFNYIDNEVGRKLRDNYTANDWYKNIQLYNLSIGVEADSIVFHSINAKDNQYNMIFYGKQFIRSKNEIVVRKLITKSSLKSVQNTILNPFGAMITDFLVVDNSDIERRNIKGEVLKSLVQ